MTGIRAARAEDVAEVVRMVGDLRATSAAACDVPLEVDVVARTVEGLIASTRGLVLVLEVDGAPRGVLMAAAQPSAWARVLEAQEVAFWIDPDCRGPWAAVFLDRLTLWARQIGVRVLGVGAFDDRVGALYARRGFVTAERSWIKVL